jgi:hypothetical protein
MLILQIQQVLSLTFQDFFVCEIFLQYWANFFLLPLTHLIIRYPIYGKMAAK